MPFDRRLYHERVLVAEVDMRGVSLDVREFHMRTPVFQPLGLVHEDVAG